MVCGKKAQYSEIIATSANQISRRNSADLQNILYYIHQIPFPLAVLKGGLGTRLVRTGPPKKEIAAGFEALKRRTSVKGGVHMHWVNS